jgi:two-component system chemotaxis response regulator CheY
MGTDKDKRYGTALIIDDMSSTRALLRDMLMSLGFDQVAMARNGVDALRKLETESYNLIISDQVMDGMTGTEFLAKLRAGTRQADVPFIMVSSVRDAPVIDSALTLGVDDYLPKPISMALLQRKIDDVFRRRAAACRA